MKGKPRHRTRPTHRTRMRAKGPALEPLIKAVRQIDGTEKEMSTASRKLRHCGAERRLLRLLIARLKIFLFCGLAHLGM